jgi:hypothetical protein
MKVSLNDLVQMLADRVGQPFNVPLQEQLKVILNYKRADWFQKILDRHPEQRRYFIKDFSVELEMVDKSECPVDIDCQVLRSIYPVPQPIRTEETFYDFVGSVDKNEAYRYMTPDQTVFAIRYNKYTGKLPTYFYANGHIYIYNDPDTEWINVRGVFSDPRSLHDFTCEGHACYTDDDDFEMPEDIINTMIQDTLKNELRQILPEQGESEITDGKNR